MDDIKILMDEHTKQVRKFELAIDAAVEAIRFEIEGSGRPPFVSASVGAMTVCQARLIARMRDEDRRMMMNDTNQSLRRLVGFLKDEATKL